MSVEDAVKNYYAFRDLDGLSDQEAVKATLDSCRTIPAAEALRAVLAYEASREHLLQP